MAKAKDPPVPRDTRLITEYSELLDYLTNFARRIYHFVWLEGHPGTGKSERVRITLSKILGDKFYHIKSGSITPLALYKQCHKHQNEPIVLDLDELESMLQNSNGRRLLLALGESKPKKLLSWETTSRALGETPEAFETSSSLCVIANEPPRYRHIRSRAVKLLFQPSNLELHKYAATWFWDQEIHNFVGSHLQRLEQLDLRSYVHAYADKLASKDWGRILLQAYSADLAEVIVQDLHRDPAFPRRKDKVRRFVELMRGRPGGSPSNYGVIRKRLQEAKRLEVQPVAPIPVGGTAPEQPDQHQETEPTAADAASARPAFLTPITGQTPPPATPTPLTQPACRLYQTDGSTSFSREEEDEDEDTDEEEEDE
jgi:hypothetical protein